MSIAKISSIVGVRPKVSRYDQEGFVTRAIVDGDEVSCWSANSEPKFKVGELVYTYFDDQYNRGGFKRIKLDKDESL
jgi:hypothetical protein